MSEPDYKRKPTVRQMSKTPSWVMLGFILGALFVWSLPDDDPATTRQRPIVLAAPPTPAPSKPAELSTVETLFATWGEHAVWYEDTAEIAIWNSGTRDFSDYYEVRRIEGVLYFRSIPQLTRRPVRHGRPMPPDCPILFTETEEQYQEWRAYGRFERPVTPSLPRPSIVTDPGPPATSEPTKAQP